MSDTWDETLLRFLQEEKRSGRLDKFRRNLEQAKKEIPGEGGTKYTKPDKPKPRKQSKSSKQRLFEKNLKPRSRKFNEEFQNVEDY